ncbi:MAG: response regulator [Prochlorotrichaceae cyanobacterium]
MDSSVSSTASGSLASEQSLSILIAEDVQVNQMVAVAILERLGYTADVVENGTKAVEAFQRQPYQLILMDICMPETDGLNATRQIRNITASETHPWIIALTAHAILGDREKCLAAGMNDYVTKPISVKTIAAAIDRYQQALSA